MVVLSGGYALVRHTPEDPGESVEAVVDLVAGVSISGWWHPRIRIECGESHSSVTHRNSCITFDIHQKSRRCRQASRTGRGLHHMTICERAIPGRPGRALSRLSCVIGQRL